MSDKLTASVTYECTAHWAYLRSGVQRFNVQPAYFDGDDQDPRKSARSIADKLTEAIAKHDKAVNAELMAMCREVVVGFTSTTGTYFDQPPMTKCLRCHDRWPVKDFERLHSGCLIARCAALVAELETSK